MDYCFICSEDFNVTNHSKINCMYCNFEACRKCCQHYILDKESNVCMNVDKKSDGSFVCQKQWSRKFIVQSFPDSWVKGKWRIMNEKVGFEREKALLPVTMNILTERKEDEIIRSQTRAIDEKLRQLYSERRQLERNLSMNKTNKTPERHFRNRACPDENCRGFLSTQWKCGVCDMWTCPDCHQVKGMTKDAHHQCNPDDVATARLLDQDTKPCPSCSTPIHKIMGCDQMWCTQCHTAFSWRTGAIQTRIHNPHFYEWQRENNGGDNVRNIGDVECGRDLGDSRALMSIRQFFRSFYITIINTDLQENLKKINLLLRKFEKIIMGTVHLNHVQINRFRTDQLVNNQDIRLSYLDKTIDEKKFKSDIIRREKAYEKKQDIFNVIQLQIQTVTDIIYRFERQLAHVEKDVDQNLLLTTVENIINVHFNELEQITKYCNNLLEEHAKTYSCKKYTISYNNSGRNRNDVLV